MAKSDAPSEKPVIDQQHSADRICIINADDGPVSFILHATNSLQVEANVDLIPVDDTATTLESLKLDMINRTEGTLNSDVQEIDNRRALIRFTAWAIHSDHYSGKIGIDICQNGQHCTISKPAEWLRIVPKYGTGQAFEWITVIHFYCTPSKSG
ncbi:MAG: hypothetical protein JW863_16675 [Chitinispirillaceae bacterium]|nr:hypothetical protein [Chitinispirillaceae bacterium]